MRVNGEHCLRRALLLAAIDFEERGCFRLLTEHYGDCPLFFGRSDGSSGETMLRAMMERRTEQAVGSFRQLYGKTSNADALRPFFPTAVRGC